MTKNPAAIPISIEHASQIPWPNQNSHKHNRGRLVVLAGGPHNTGAARLTAAAGQRIGAGWVTLLGEPAACDIMASHETSILIVCRNPHCTLAAQLEGFDAIVAGPALGLELRNCADVLVLAVNAHCPLVLDADALKHIADDQIAMFKALHGRAIPTVLTPHGGEFTSLFGAFGDDAKVTATLDGARKSGCVVVHKGAQTVVASPDGQCFTSTHATPFLATAGTGDVLAGMIGGLLAQGMSPLGASLAAVWIHGEAGRRLGAGLIAEDLVDMLPDILNQLAPAALQRTSPPKFIL